MKKHFKKLLSFVLVLTFIFSAFSQVAFGYRWASISRRIKTYGRGWDTYRIGILYDRYYNRRLRRSRKRIYNIYVKVDGIIPTLYRPINVYIQDGWGWRTRRFYQYQPTGMFNGWYYYQLNPTREYFNSDVIKIGSYVRVPRAYFFSLGHIQWKFR